MINTGAGGCGSQYLHRHRETSIENVTGSNITSAIMEVGTAVDALMQSTLSNVDTCIVDMSTVPDSQPTPVDHFWGADDSEGEDETSSTITTPGISPTIVKQKLSKFSRKRTSSGI